MKLSFAGLPEEDLASVCYEIEKIQKETNFSFFSQKFKDIHLN